MDNKRFMVGLFISSALFLAWWLCMSYLDRTHPEWNVMGKRPPTTQQVENRSTATGPTTSLATAGVAKTTAMTTAISTTTQSVGGTGAAIAAAPTTAAAIQPVAATQPRTTDLGQIAPKGTYAMGLGLDARGASIDSVTLNDFKQVVDKPEPYRFQQPYAIAPDSSRALATRSVTVDGVECPITDVAWRRVSATESSAVYTLDLTRDGKPLLRLRKTFELRPRKDRSDGYEVLVTLGYENLTAQALKIKTSFNGPTTPPREVDRGPDRQMIVGYIDQQRASTSVGHHFIEEFQKDKSSQNLVKSDKGLPMLWAGAGSVYFNAFIRPDPIAGTKGIVPAYIGDVQTQVMNPDSPVEEHEVSMVFDTNELTVPAGATLALPLRVYFGPRDRNVLDNAYYSELPFNYNATLVITSGMCAFCTFDWLIQVLVFLLQMFHAVVRDWGLAIICLVCVVRLVLHPITKKSQVSMLKMGKMGPEMERLKKKYGDNKEELNKAMMQFYKEQGVTPVLGCLPMFLQMPIWIALWQALQTEFALRHAPFLWGLTWIHDLAKPDALITFAHPVPLMIFGWTLHSINILPILMAIVTVINQKYMPQAAATTSEAAQQQKMMKWMSVLFPLMFYTMPSGLNLYYVTSMGLGIVESKRIREHIKEQEEAEKDGKVIVETKPTRQSKKNKDEGTKKRATAEPKKPGFMGWLAELQARAEQLRNPDRRGK